MNAICIELCKEKRTGITPVFLAAGILGAAYAFANFTVRGEALLRLPLDPMDILLTQLYGVIMIMNMFGIVAAGAMIYNMEFKGNAIRKMYMLPISASVMYLCKFAILSVLLFIAIAMQNIALVQIGQTNLPQEAFVLRTAVVFAGYSFLTAMPVLSFMLLISSRFENIWVPLGIGVAGFLSAMAMAGSSGGLSLLHPFVVMLKPAVAMSATPDMGAALAAVAETVVFLAGGIWMAYRLHYE